ncbi:MAG: transposase [Peptococcaceae bacterium]|nr:transposase [Peptococcaceae bacterium]
MKVLIILYFVVIAAMIIMVPVKLLTSVQSNCHRCRGKIFYSKRKREFRCPHCGAEIIKNGLAVSRQDQ